MESFLFIAKLSSTNASSISWFNVRFMFPNIIIKLVLFRALRAKDSIGISITPSKCPSNFSTSFSQLASVRAATGAQRNIHEMTEIPIGKCHSVPMTLSVITIHNRHIAFDSNWTIMSITARGLLWIFLHLVFFARAFHQFYNLSIISHESAREVQKQTQRFAIFIEHPRNQKEKH